MQRLEGKTIIFLGSSVTEGFKSGGWSFVDELEKTDGIIPIKEAVSGTTLVDVTNECGESYITRMKKLDTKINADAFICQLSTNDATRGYQMTDIEQAMCEIIEYARATWNCPVYFYTGTKYDSDLYKSMVDMLYNIKKRDNIEILDFWNDEEMNAVSPEDYTRYMADPIHPTKAGYIEWWTPKFRSFLEEHL